MADPVGYGSNEYVHGAELKLKPVDARDISEIVRHTEELAAALKAREADKLKERELASRERLALERAQDEARVVAQKLTAQLWATPRKSWNQDQRDIFARINKFLEASK